MAKNNFVTQCLIRKKLLSKQFPVLCRMMKYDIEHTTLHSIPLWMI